MDVSNKYFLKLSYIRWSSEVLNSTSKLPERPPGKQRRRKSFNVKGNATNDEVGMPLEANLNGRKASQEGDLEADVEVHEATLEANIEIRKVNQEVNVVVDGKGGVALTENFGMDPAAGLVDLEVVVIDIATEVVDLEDSVDQDVATETDRKPDVKSVRNLVMSSCRNLVVSSVRNLMVRSARS